MQFYYSGAVNAVLLYSCNVLRNNFFDNVCLHIGLSYRHSLYYLLLKDFTQSKVVKYGFADPALFKPHAVIIFSKKM